MSVNTTPFLHLPQWEANEQPSYLGEINPAFAAIDVGYGDIKTLAQTGVSGSQDAITASNAAKAQSQANAGAITTLQQELTQLKADFVNGHYVRQITLTSDPVENVSARRQIITYNDYMAHIYFEILFTSDSPISTTDVTLLNNVGGMPGSVRKLNGITNIQIPDTQYIPAASFNGVTLKLVGLPGTHTLKAGNYACFFTVPIFILPSNQTKENLMDNCLYFI